MPTKPPRTWGRSTVDTACPLDCPDSCSLSVSVERGRVAAIDGSKRTPTTNGFICAKVRRFGDRVYGLERLLYPAVRSGRKGDGTFRRVSWDEALQTIAERLEEVRRTVGGEAILPFCYGGSNGLVTQGTTDADFFAALGSSRLARTLCAAPTGAAAQAMYGKMAGVAYEDYVHARLIIVWGANPSASGIHLVPFIREARARGAALVVVDPRQTSLAKLADLHVPIRPGTDVAVALSVHRYLFEHGHADSEFLDAHARGAAELRERARPWTFERAGEVSGVAPAMLHEMAELYRATTPAVIRCGWGLERNRNGGNAALAVLALPAVAGKFGVRGGGYTMSNSAAWGLATSAWRRVPDPDTRVVNMNRLGRALTELDNPPVKCLFVYNCNPVATVPDQNRILEGLAREDLFTVVFEQVMTDTAQFADVLLPATTFLETYDIARGYGAYNLQLVKPAIDVAGEARSNMEVFAELAARLGQRDDVEGEAETMLRVASAIPADVRDAVLGDGAQPLPPGGRTPVQFVDVQPRTADGKIDLFPEALEREAPDGLYRFQADPATEQFPLALISPASEKTISSTLGELRTAPASLYMHGADAAERGINTADVVRVFNALGEVHCTVTVGDAITQGTVSLPKGLWRRHTINGATATALAPDGLTDLGGGASFNDARVQVTRILPAALGERPVSVWVADDASVREP
ncbi:MAG: ynfE [Acidobacteria bacterium]|jgi:anaerobic selenocysteine-containing dehydrogenase|nr:ynfE [Acidobacteriota bacterium]